jgi:hypothetical protein
LFVVVEALDVSTYRACAHWLFGMFEVAAGQWFDGPWQNKY